MGVPFLVKNRSVLNIYIYFLCCLNIYVYLCTIENKQILKYGIMVIKQKSLSQAPTVELMQAILELTREISRRLFATFTEFVCILLSWLRAKHLFLGDSKDDSIYCTGWQFIGLNVIIVCVALFISVEWELAFS